VPQSDSALLNSFWSALAAKFVLIAFLVSRCAAVSLRETTSKYGLSITQKEKFLYNRFPFRWEFKKGTLTDPSGMKKKNADLVLNKVLPCLE
jgi:hypothetical protein